MAKPVAALTDSGSAKLTSSPTNSPQAIGVHLVGPRSKRQHQPGRSGKYQRFHDLPYFTPHRGGSISRRPSARRIPHWLHLNT